MAGSNYNTINRFYYGFGYSAFCTRREEAGLQKVNPLYLTGGALAAFIIFSEVTAIQHVGVTLTISALLIAQLFMTFMIDSNGWFGVVKQKMRLPQFIGIGMMIAGVLILKL